MHLATAKRSNLSKKREEKKKRIANRVKWRHFGRGTGRAEN